MSQVCGVNKCDRTTRGLCDCCIQNLCLQHLTEHNALLVSQLDNLVDEINVLGDRLQAPSFQKLVDNCYQKLEDWRRDCHETIDRFFKQKRQEICQSVDDKIKKQQNEIHSLQSKVNELVRRKEATRQEIDLLTSTIRQVEINLSNIEQTCFQVGTRPLILDDTSVFLKETIEHNLDLSTISSNFKKVYRPDGSAAVINSNDKFLLMHRAPNLSLINQDMNIIKEVSWTYGQIIDICWSVALNRFIITGGRTIFLVDENTMVIDKMKITKTRDWLSCTCSETFLFLSTNQCGSAILQFRLLPSIEFVKEWISPETCQNDEAILGIRYNNEKLGVTIRNNSKKSLRIELRHAETFDSIWSLPLDTICNRKLVFRCCLLTSNEWLITDYEIKRLLHITKDGNLKSVIPYSDAPYYANLFANNLVISTIDGINIHKL